MKNPEVMLVVGFGETGSETGSGNQYPRKRGRGNGVGEPISKETGSGKRGRGTNIQFHSGQLASVKSLGGEFEYGYDSSNPALLKKMAGPAHSVETSYEPHRNLITGVVNRMRAVIGDRLAVNGGTEAGAPGTSAPAADSGPSTKHQGPRTLSSHLYANDLLGRRETISQGGEAFGMLALGENRVEVAYNDRSEVVGSVTRRGDIPVARHTYAYDAIGNRQRSASEVGTRAAGRRSKSESNRKSEVSYEANALNQYQEWKSSSVPSVPSVVKPVHDPDGNLLEDARNTYTWNADNNLVRVESKDGSLRLDYVYDHQSRRTVRIETTNRGKDNESRRTTYYLYDDWNLLADVSAVTGDGSRVTGEEADAVRYYTWGRDLSGSLQGAGGVGGLLAISRGEAHRYPTYDANGNIGQLIDNAGAIVAAYTYDPFGNVTEMAGAEAAENEWRFSTKPVEAGTGWLYYGYRWYDAGMGRWVNRDPIEESGGVNLYGFVGNDGVGSVDVLGFASCAEIAARIRDIGDTWNELGKLQLILNEKLRLASTGAHMEARSLRDAVNKTMANLAEEIERLKAERGDCDNEIGKACCENSGGRWIPRKSCPSDNCDNLSSTADLIAGIGATIGGTAGALAPTPYRPFTAVLGAISGQLLGGIAGEHFCNLEFSCY